MSNHNLLPAQISTAAYQRPSFRIFWESINYAVLFKRTGFHRNDYWRRRLNTPRNHESALGKPVARVEGFVAKTIRRKSISEAFQYLIANWLRAVKGHTPTAQ